MKPKSVAAPPGQVAREKSAEAAIRAAPLVRGSDDGSFSAAPIIVIAVFGLGLVMLGAAAVPPQRVPWPALAQPLFVHRVDLVLFGFGTIAVGVFCLAVTGQY